MEKPPPQLEHVETIAHVIDEVSERLEVDPNRVFEKSAGNGYPTWKKRNSHTMARCMSAYALREARVPRREIAEGLSYSMAGVGTALAYADRVLRFTDAQDVLNHARNRLKTYPQLEHAETIAHVIDEVAEQLGVDPNLIFERAYSNGTPYWQRERNNHTLGRRVSAYCMRNAGVPHQEIAETLKYSLGSVSGAVDYARSAARRPDVQEVIEAVDTRLND